ncbi:MAG: NAD(P)-binding protein, partial [Nocardioidaceae bacterium]|nr:NAD(P)-binding protein [Nocardioidaceae bacterium]
MTSSRRRVAVVGAGIAGLSAAHALLVAEPDLQVTLY